MPWLLASSTPFFSTVSTNTREAMAPDLAPCVKAAFWLSFKLPQNDGDTSTAMGAYTWAVSVGCFCTCHSLAEASTEIGFSWPSIVPCCSAPITSGQDMGVGDAPSVRKAVMCTGFSVTRIFRPLRSATPLTACLLLDRWRKPCSPQASATRPRLQNLASSSWPKAPSSTARACCVSRNRKGMSTTPTSGRSEEHTSELQSHLNLVCRLLLEKKKKKSHL